MSHGNDVKAVLPVNSFNRPKLSSIASSYGYTHMRQVAGDQDSLYLAVLVAVFEDVATRRNCLGGFSAVQRALSTCASNAGNGGLATPGKTITMSFGVLNKNLREASIGERIVSEQDILATLTREPEAYSMITAMRTAVCAQILAAEPKYRSKVPAGYRTAPRVDLNKQWACAACTYLNKPASAKCSMCGNLRPSSPGEGKGVREYVLEYVERGGAGRMVDILAAANIFGCRFSVVDEASQRTIDIGESGKRLATLLIGEQRKTYNLLYAGTENIPPDRKTAYGAQSALGGGSMAGPARTPRKSFSSAVPQPSDSDSDEESEDDIAPPPPMPPPEEGAPPPAFPPNAATGAAGPGSPTPAAADGKARRPSKSAAVAGGPPGAKGGAAPIVELWPCSKCGFKNKSKHRTCKECHVGKRPSGFRRMVKQQEQKQIRQVIAAREKAGINRESKEAQRLEALYKAPAPEVPEYANGARMPSIEPRGFVDCRDRFGKWCEAEILSHSPAASKIRVHYVQWASKWDEDIDIKQEPFRLSNFHSYSPQSKIDVDLCGKLRLGDEVFVFRYRPAPHGWIRGVVGKISPPHFRVEYMVGSEFFQYWYHIRSDEYSVHVPSANLLEDPEDIPPPPPDEEEEEDQDPEQDRRSSQVAHTVLTVEVEGVRRDASNGMAVVRPEGEKKRKKKKRRDSKMNVPKGKRVFSDIEQHKIHKEIRRMQFEMKMAVLKQDFAKAADLKAKIEEKQSHLSSQANSRVKSMISALESKYDAEKQGSGKKGNGGKARRPSIRRPKHRQSMINVLKYKKKAGVSVPDDVLVEEYNRNKVVTIAESRSERGDARVPKKAVRKKGARRRSVLERAKALEAGSAQPPAPAASQPPPPIDAQPPAPADSYPGGAAPKPLPRADAAPPMMQAGGAAVDDGPPIDPALLQKYRGRPIDELIGELAMKDQLADVLRDAQRTAMKRIALLTTDLQAKTTECDSLRAKLERGGAGGGGAGMGSMFSQAQQTELKRKEALIAVLRQAQRESADQIQLLKIENAQMQTKLNALTFEQRNLVKKKKKRDSRKIQWN